MLEYTNHIADVILIQSVNKFVYGAKYINVEQIRIAGHYNMYMEAN